MLTRINGLKYIIDDGEIILPHNFGYRIINRAVSFFTHSKVYFWKYHWSQNFRICEQMLYYEKPFVTYNDLPGKIRLKRNKYANKN